MLSLFERLINIPLLLRSPVNRNEIVCAFENLWYALAFICGSRDFCYNIYTPVMVYPIMARPKTVPHCKAVRAWQLRNQRCSTQADQALYPKDPLRESGVPAAEPLMIKVPDRIVYLSRHPLGTCSSPFVSLLTLEKPQTSSNFKWCSGLSVSSFVYFIRERRRWSAQCAQALGVVFLAQSYSFMQLKNPRIYCGIYCGISTEFYRSIFRV